MPSKSTVVVRNLPRRTTKEDVKTFFDHRLKNEDAFVFPLVQDTQNRAGDYQCTIVVLESSIKAAGNLNGQEIVPKAGGGRSRIQIDTSLKGPITLAEHTNPQFDLYFLHGLGGNALSSWVCEMTGHMWPRDSFPEQCRNMGVRGRFSSLGYDAKVVDAGEPKTIEKAAVSILKYVAADRPPGCTRPIFFVCHSLGGLVVTQAIVTALGKPAIKPEYQFIQHLIKGVAFFGTPFHGSRNADILAPVVGLVAGTFSLNINFLDDMRTYSKSLPALLMDFNYIRTEEEIELLLFVEKNRDGLSKVTTATSASFPFKFDVAPIEIDANHRNMVKFPNAAEARLPITEIVNMIKRQLYLVPGPHSPQSGLVDRRKSLGPNALTPPRKSIVPLPVPGLPDVVCNTDKNEGFNQLKQFDTIFVVDDTGSMQLPAKSTDVSGSNVKTRWDVLTKALQYIAQIAATYDKDGVDISFLISEDLNATNITTGQEVLDLLDQVDLTKGSGGTYFEPVLAEILGPYVSNYEDFFEKKKRGEKTTKPKPINIIVLTDGMDDEEEATEELLVRIAGQLDKMNAPKSQVGIQFLQVGDDPDAAAFLDRLDNEIKVTRGVRDFVDTKTFKDLEKNDADFTENLRLILLGAVNSKLDKVAKVAH